MSNAENQFTKTKMNNPTNIIYLAIDLLFSIEICLPTKKSFLLRASLFSSEI